ncbi:MAG: hypothetical protein NTZ42_04550 [Candidatus Gribaldobacteria bacterium]|nr:hypothetical protein [Candidatus Gribaldobacteria bacterium]
MDEEWIQLIKSSLLTASEQQDLLALLEKDGPNEQFLGKFKPVIGAMAKREVEKTRLALEKFRQETEQAKTELLAKKEKLWQDSQSKLAQIATDDVGGQEEILEQYHQQVVDLWRGLEEKTQSIATAIMSEQIKNNGSN